MRALLRGVEPALFIEGWFVHEVGALRPGSPA